MRVIYVPTLKVGCTSVMWALAGVEGTLASRGTYSELGDQSRDQAIHNPRIHGLPSLATFTAGERQVMLSDSGWTRFCVTRDPYARLLSGWLNRAFLYSTGAELSFVPEDPLVEPFVPNGDTVEDVGIRFRSFVRRLVSDGKRSPVDPHFATQMSLTRPDVFPYTDIVRLSDLGVFAARVASGDPRSSGFDPRARNVSLEIGPDEVFDAKTAALVDEYYAEDFERFGYANKSFPDAADSLTFSTREMALVRMLLERSDRLIELASLKNPPRPVRDGFGRVKRAIRRRVRPDR